MIWHSTKVGVVVGAGLPVVGEELGATETEGVELGLAVGTSVGAMEGLSVGVSDGGKVGVRVGVMIASNRSEGWVESEGSEDGWEGIVEGVVDGLVETEGALVDGDLLAEGSAEGETETVGPLDPPDGAEGAIVEVKISPMLNPSKAATSSIISAMSSICVSTRSCSCCNSSINPDCVWRRAFHLEEAARKSVVD